MTDSKGLFDDSMTLLDCTNYLRNLTLEFPYLSKVPFSDLDGTNPDFFQSRSLAVHIGAMLHAFVVSLLPKYSLRMGFLYNSNTERSGKTLQCKMSITPIVAKPMAAQAWARKDEDLKKILDAEALRASSYICFDNVKGHIQSQVLEAFMTSAMWTGRVLGRSEMFEAENYATIFLSGNNCTLGADLANRFLVVNLFVSEGDVQERRVQHPINDAWLMQPINRDRIRSALWGLVRYWDAAGAPKPTGRLRLGYEDYCTIVGGIVEHAGFGDCLADPEVEQEVNTEKTDIRALINALMVRDDAMDDPQRDAHRLQFTFQQVVDTAREAGVFDWLLDGKEEGGSYVLNKKSESSFGLMLRRYFPLEGARLFRMTEQQVVHTRVSGRNRHKRFLLELSS